MPNRETFKIKPINKFLSEVLDSPMIEGLIIDPFVRNSVFKHRCNLTNDLDPSIEASFNLDAGKFLAGLENNSVAFMFFDPPYSPRQVKDCYKGIGKDFMKADAQSSFYSSVRNIAKDKISPGGLVASFGWNSTGMGKTRGFEMLSVLLVNHGGAIHDTICTIERKL